MTASPIDLCRQLEIVTQQIIRARIYFDLWWFYKSDHTRPKIIDTMNDFSEFFRFDEHAQFVSMVIHCGAVWDKSKGSISLMSLARQILDPKGPAADKKLLDEVTKYQTEASGLVTIRNEAIAHRSATFDFPKAFARAQLVPSLVPTMMENWLVAANNLRGRKNLPEEFFVTMPLDDVKALILKLGGSSLDPNSSLSDISNP